MFEVNSLRNGEFFFLCYNWGVGFDLMSVIIW